MRNEGLTDHAAIRMAQRGFSADDLTIIQMIGIEVEGGYFVREKECRQMEERIKQILARVRRLAGARVVVADNSVVTAYHTQKMKERKLLRRAEDRELMATGRDETKANRAGRSH